MDATATASVAAGSDGDVGMTEAAAGGGGSDNEGEDNWDNVASGSEEDNDGFGGGSDDDGGGYSDGGDAEAEADEDNDDDGGDDEDDDDEDRDMIILCSSSVGRWERYEAALEAAEAAEATKRALSSSQDVARKRQIFAPREAFAMLSRELTDFMRSGNTEMAIETAGDDLYHWLVDLGSFDPASQLGKDMREVSRRYCYSSVRLRLRFMRGLHPFFPPSVEVVWPHLAGPLLGAVASHPLLALENWDPWRPALAAVAQIKAFLEAHARVDLDNPANDIRRHPTSTYSPLERSLARLEALSGMPPVAAAQPDVAALYAAREDYERDTARLAALAEGGKKRARAEAATGAAATAAAGALAGARGREVVWARGTGYGSGSRTGESWNVEASQAAQAARDEEIRGLLAVMASALAWELGAEGPAVAGTEAAAAEQAGATEVSGSAAADGPQQQRGKAEAMEGVETEATASDAGGSGGRGSGAGASSGAGTSGFSSQGDEPLLGPGGCAEVIRASCLLPFLARELRGASFSDMGSRNSYYTALLTVIRELCRTSTAELLWSPAEQPRSPADAGAAGAPGGSSRGSGSSLAGLVTGSLRSAARLYLNVLAPSAGAPPPPGPGATTAAAPGPNVASTSAAASALPAPLRPIDKAAVAAQKAAIEADATQRMARMIGQIVEYLERHRPPPAQQQQGGAAGAADLSAHEASGRGAEAERTASGAAASTSAASGSGAGGSSATAVYLATLKPLQVDAVPDLCRSHHYASQARGEMAAPRTRAVRLAKEIASLESLLPLSESSSVFVRVDETAVHVWKALIVGPEDTPYSGGCFLFDFYFPPQYPGVPPQVHLLTTGGGRVRFNPNLYAEGKVCLSLLGTWSGDKGETWNSEVSTAVQVLISIQSLIMVPQPYFNEPSYEAQTDERGKTMSRDYSKNVRENCVRYAMLDVLRHPPVSLAEVVRQHFRLRREPLLRQIDSWADEGQAHDAAHAGRLREMRRELAALMSAL
ncbi:hypothetical protein GPECTOR_299g811 [Gonium pectorale]|uniref:UBC core domain-containing protein n=1 Tax=Gonium pectorale TaxID=33097 RepID=A0A150FVV5_GONPE|nr:hypothetical protein GPECTOR_299g811 [Gonium pectorale]|eukprot:KXZ41741.1 hypothetical protein GPECTOR_299g811 [Gonium pectorale]